jgi:2-polyprenyl-6-methoxyphenol hydroxylase-like FAD-dependent oxidoreductase
MKRLRACGALIAGGGPAGLMLAIALAGAGRDVVLIEKPERRSTRSAVNL